MKLTEYRVDRTGTGNLEALVSSCISQEIELYQDTCFHFFLGVCHKDRTLPILCDNVLWADKTNFLKPYFNSNL